MNGDSFYLDTSALFPYYREEPASRQIQSILNDMKPPVFLSDLTRVEIASAIARCARMREIDDSQAALIENAFNQDAGMGLYRVMPLTMIHYQQAEKWLFSRKTALRTLDALHVACCRSLEATLITIHQNT
jgi:predicted nucleic acid-binding protein